MAVVLTIVTQDGATIEHEVKSKFTIGRSKSCDLKIDDSQMSGKHGFLKSTLMDSSFMGT